jgi:hypothetical protein
MPSLKNVSRNGKTPDLRVRFSGLKQQAKRKDALAQLRFNPLHNGIRIHRA